MNELTSYISSFSNYGGDNATIYAPKDKSQNFVRCTIKLIEIKNQSIYQCTTFSKTQAFHSNVPKEEIIEFIEEQLSSQFNQMEWDTDGFHHSIRMSKKGKALHSKKATGSTVAPSTDHNRKKEYLLPQGEIIPPLVDLGIFTKEGKIVASMYDKFKQINRFVELIDDVVKQEKVEALNIIDFGCGKSYLTFIVYHYLNYIKKIPTTITGMDLKEQVIDDCNAIAKKYGYANLNFVKGDIADYTPTCAVDMVITLHACDIATDFAIYHAINLGSKAILSVPCCQHEFNGQIKNSPKTIFTRYGLVKERFSALATDAIRGNILELMGYRTQLLEFVDLTHSPKNILIRSVKTSKPLANPKVLKAEIFQFIDEYKVTPMLYTLLKEKIDEI